MKKVVLLTAILLVAVVSTSCINNLAIQELNNKAKVYMDKGEVNTAICRLQASLDLDGEVFETRYNLALAYINIEEFEKAQEELKIAHKLKPEFLDYYYSLALATEGEAFKKVDSFSNPTEDNSSFGVDKPVKQEFSDEDKILVVKKMTEAIELYNEYLSKQSDTKNKEAIDNRIQVLNSEIQKYNLPASNNTENVLR